MRIPHATNPHIERGHERPVKVHGAQARAQHGWRMRCVVREEASGVSVAKYKRGQRWGALDWVGGAVPRVKGCFDVMAWANIDSHLSLLTVIVNELRENVHCEGSHSLRAFVVGTHTHAPLCYLAANVNERGEGLGGCA